MIATHNRPDEKRVAISQSNYIPWKGYFDLISKCNEFILYDDMQYTRRDWRNRNRIKTKDGVQWLTIPVEVKGKYFQTIKETTVSDRSWAKSHWRRIGESYCRAPYFPTYCEAIEAMYRTVSTPWLSEINRHFLGHICRLLGIHTKLSTSMDYRVAGGKTERLVSLCKSAQGTCYLSGPAAREYIDPTLFSKAGLDLFYIDYSGYPQYNQLFPPFDHAVTILDVLFNLGPNAPLFCSAGTLHRHVVAA